jgi:tetratricopeptide (TPR) repeat protein
MESAPNHYNFGLELAASGNIREAIIEFRTASRLDTADADALSEIGRLEIGEKRHRDAAASLDEALSRNPQHAGALNNRGVVDFLEARYTEAAGRFRAAVLADPSLADAWYNLADTCELLGDIDGKKEAQLRFQELFDDN